MGRWEAVWKKLVPGGPTSILALLALLCFFGAVWLFGWAYPARSDLEGLLRAAFISNGTLRVFTDKGEELTIDNRDVSEIGEIRCDSESRRRRPTIHYDCLYELSGKAGARYRLILAADYNKGWKRMNMADYGDYRLIYASPEEQRAILHRLGNQ